MKKLILLIFVLVTLNDANAQWTHIGYGATVNCLLVTGSYPSNFIYAGVPNSTHGVYYSANYGDSWNGNDWYPNYATCNSLTQGGSSIIAGTDIGILVSSDIYCSSWTKIYTLIGDVYSFAKNGGTIYTGTEYGVNSTTDNGTNWTTCNHVDLNFPVFSLAVNGAKMFAGTAYGVYYSSNSGGNWTLVNNGMPPSGNATVTSIVINGTKVFAGTSVGVFFTTNDGSSWTSVNNGLPNTSITALVTAGTKIFAGTFGDGVFVSTNDGGSWTAFNTGFSTSSDYYVLSLATNGTRIFAGTSGDGTWMRSTSDVSEVEELDDRTFHVRIYPNPAHDVITLNTGEEDAFIAVCIYNMLGEIVRSELLKANQKSINVSDLQNGIYKIEIKTSKRTEIQSLIIRR